MVAEHLHHLGGGHATLQLHAGLHVFEHLDIVASGGVGKGDGGSACEFEGVLLGAGVSLVALVQGEHSHTITGGLVVKGAEYASEVERGHQVNKGGAAGIGHGLSHHAMQRAAE